MCVQIETLGNLFEVVRQWEGRFFGTGLGFPLVWYRGQQDASWDLQPTVLRSWFLARVLTSTTILSPPEVQLVQRERTINNQFRRMSASQLEGNLSCTDIYFQAQHYGMPTRLLDWSGSPLVALFFTVNAFPNADGRMFAMNPRFLIPDNQDPQQPVYPADVVDIRHPAVEAAIEPLFGQGQRCQHPFILPILPDLHAGRLLQQSSCFTLHMPPAITAGVQYPQEPAIHVRGTNTTLEEYVVPAAAKADLLVDLRRAGIHYATIFPDLDNVSREIRTAWQMYP